MTFLKPILSLYCTNCYINLYPTFPRVGCFFLGLIVAISMGWSRSWRHLDLLTAYQLSDAELSLPRTVGDLNTQLKVYNNDERYELWLWNYKVTLILKYKVHGCFKDSTWRPFQAVSSRCVLDLVDLVARASTSWNGNAWRFQCRDSHTTAKLAKAFHRLLRFRDNWHRVAGKFPLC